MSKWLPESGNIKSIQGLNWQFEATNHWQQSTLLFQLAWHTTDPFH
jgi:hypothetical protein